MSRKLYTLLLKFRVIALLYGEGKSVPQLLKELNLAQSNFCAWRAKFKVEKENTSINYLQEDATVLELRCLLT